MLYRLIPALTLAAFFIAAAPPARAQLDFGLSAGVSLPQSTLADEVKSGYNLNAMVSWSIPLSPVGFRAALGFNRFSLEQSNSGNRSVLDGAANLVLSMPSTSLVRPYVTAGVGAYNVKSTLVGGDGGLTQPLDTPSQTHLGFNGGVGVSLGIGGLRTMVEARYVLVAAESRLQGTARSGSAPTRYVPISFGFIF